MSRNGYPLSVLDGVIHDVINKFEWAKRCTDNKCPVYLLLPYIGHRGKKFAKCITTAVGKCYFSAVVRIILCTRTAFLSHCIKTPYLPTISIRSNINILLGVAVTT